MKTFSKIVLIATALTLVFTASSEAGKAKGKNKNQPTPVVEVIEDFCPNYCDQLEWGIIEDRITSCVWAKQECVKQDDSTGFYTCEFSFVTRSYPCSEGPPRF